MTAIKLGYCTYHDAGLPTGADLVSVGIVSRSVTILPFEIPPAGEAIAVAPGIFWVRMPLPFQLDHINLWLLDDGDGWTMVDTGVFSQTTQDHWEVILGARLGGRPLKRLVCTHSHPDHMGLAGWVADRWGAELWTSHGEWLAGRRFSTMSADPDVYRAHYRAAGCRDEEFAPAVGHIGGARGLYVAVPENYRRLRAGDMIEMAGQGWQVRVAYGHSVEHVCLYCPALNLMIGGDQFLAKITPALVVPVGDATASPLREFLDSNKLFLDLPDDVRILPSHNLPFAGLAIRIAQYEAHHASRLDATLAACDTPARCIDVARRIFTRPIEGRSLFFAIGETLAHLRYLQDDGLIVDECDSENVWRFRRA